MKRFLCGFLCLCLLWTGISLAFAEDDEEDPGLIDELIDEENEEIEQTGSGAGRVTGKVYPTPTAEDFNLESPAVYTCKLGPDRPIFKVMDPTYSNKNVLVRGQNGGMEADVLYVGLKWMIVRRGNAIGYTMRQWVDFGSIKPVDPANTPPFNVQKHAYIAVTATYCHVRKDMSLNEGAGDDGNNYVILNPGTKITVWKFYEGWAVVNYMREYGYIDPNELTDLRPVSPTDEEMFEDCPIAAYTSYYKMTQTETNRNRIHNIRVGAGYISIVVEPGQEFNANKIMGNYNASRGYLPAGVLIEGQTVQGYGGGTCQVGSTLYNVVRQLPKVQILQRRPHGGNGASYLPIHCDAAVGTSELNLRWINGYDFPLQIEACTNDDGALSIRIYKVHE